MLFQKCQIKTAESKMPNLKCRIKDAELEMLNQKC
jgi:hypothetical protein